MVNKHFPRQLIPLAYCPHDLQGKTRCFGIGMPLQRGLFEGIMLLQKNKTAKFQQSMLIS
jgi:hypothetical protein